MKLNYLFAALLLPGFILAQTPEKNKEVEQIVITKKGTANEKLNIVVDGDKVTVNGDQLDTNDKNADVTVTRRKIKDIDVWMEGGLPGETKIIRQLALGPKGQAIGAPNSAMLGVATTKTDEGVKVMAITKNSAAEIAGLKEGDIITELDRNQIERPDDLSELIRDKKPGDKVTIGYIRNKKQRTVVAELQKWEPDLNNLSMQPFPGFDMKELRDRLGEIRMNQDDIQMYKLGFPTNRPKLGIKIQDMDQGSGVKIIEVVNDSDAAKAGLKSGDIIKKIDGKEIGGADEMRSKVFSVKPGDDLQITVERSGKTQNVNVHLSKKIKTADL